MLEACVPVSLRAMAAMTWLLTGFTSTVIGVLRGIFAH